MLLNLLQFISSDESDLLNDESDDDGSDSGSAGTYNFLFLFDEYVCPVGESVGHISGVECGVFVLIGTDSIIDVVMLVVVVTKGVESKCGELIEIFWRPES